ncbi:MAG: hypothetical protein R2827_00400 [Bdellovibrionales bacterium]
MQNLIFILVFFFFVQITSANNSSHDIEYETIVLAQSDSQPTDDVVLDTGGDYYEESDEGFEETPEMEEQEQELDPTPEPTFDEENAEESSANEITETETSNEETTQYKNMPAASGSMMRLQRDCGMYSGTSTSSQKVRVLKSGKKLWVEPQSESWVKVFRKNGVAYVEASCFN